MVWRRQLIGTRLLPETPSPAFAALVQQSVLAAAVLPLEAPAAPEAGMFGGGPVPPVPVCNQKIWCLLQKRCVTQGGGWGGSGSLRVTAWGGSSLWWRN